MLTELTAASQVTEVMWIDCRFPGNLGYVVTCLFTPYGLWGGNAP